MAYKPDLHGSLYSYRTRSFRSRPVIQRLLTPGSEFASGGIALRGEVPQIVIPNYREIKRKLTQFEDGTKGVTALAARYQRPSPLLAVLLASYVPLVEEPLGDGVVFSIAGLGDKRLCGRYSMSQRPSITK